MPELIPGSFRPEHVSIPGHFTGPQAQAAAETVRIFAERLAAGDDRPAPISCRWLAGRLGWRDAQGEPAIMAVSRALAALVELGWLSKGEPMPGRDGRRGTHTFLPGPLLVATEPIDRSLAAIQGRLSAASAVVEFECPF